MACHGMKKAHAVQWHINTPYLNVTFLNDDEKTKEDSSHEKVL